MSWWHALGIHRLLPAAAGRGIAAPGVPTGAARRSPSPKARAARPTQASMQPVSLRRRMALRPPSFTDLLPYVAYAPQDRVFVLKDGCSLGVMFELGAVPTEAMQLPYLVDRARKVQEVLQAIPESETSPWIVQFYVNDDRNIDALNDQLRDYILSQHRAAPEQGREVLNSAYTQSVLQAFREHLAQVSRPEGLFVDTQVTGQTWRGQQRRLRCCLYKRFDGKTPDDASPATQQLEAVALTLEATLTEAGITVRRCTGKDLYEWLLPLFNRQVPWARDEADLLAKAPYAPGAAGAAQAANAAPPDDGESPDMGLGTGAPIFGHDFSELLNFSEPYSRLADGVFEFDGQPVKVMTLQGMRQAPQIGHFSAELRNGSEHFARFDRLPPGSMLSISLSVRPQHLVERHLERMRDASRAKTAAAGETFRECEAVLEHMQQGDKLFPMMLTLYITGRHQDEIDQAVAATNALLVPTGLRFVTPRHDLVPLDVFLRGLPFNFDPAFDERALRRSRLTFASHIAALLPVYGRSRGTPHPGMWFWNRGGEPIWVDPLNRLDRKKNAHMLVLGPTGAGKSATLIYQCMLTMAIHRPRLVIVDAGRSFDLLVQYFAAKGLSTHSVCLTSESTVSLPPFVHAHALLEDRDVMGAFTATEGARVPGARDGMPADEQMEAVLRQARALADEDPDEDPEDGDEPDDAGEKRDLLGEMLIAALMMITGGEQREEARMSRADRYLITKAIILAAMRSRQAGRPHPLTQDVAQQLMDMQADRTLSPSRQQRAEEMGQSMMAFTQGLRGILFNRVGEDWPDVDVTLVEMGTLTKDGYGDALAVAYTSLIDAVQSRGERAQHEGRPLVFLTDEGHLITTSDLLGPKITKGTKMWRKLNMWFWLATQNLLDFPNSMERVLSMCEYWMLLTMDKAEIDQVARFRTLTEEQRSLVESARKESPKYTEGVLISAAGQFLFRNVPPALPIALAMTEGHEKAHRRRLMREHGCSELEAAQRVALALAAARS
jgi:conjugative transfer ATPase